MLSPYYYQLIVITCINVIMALSLNLVTGFAGQLSLGHAAFMGIDITQYKVLAFVIGASWAGIAGGLFAHWFRYLNPSSFAFGKSVEILSMVVLGGMGNLEGPVLGAAVLTYAPELLRGASDFVSQYRMLFYGALLVIMMLVRPQGLAGAWVFRGFRLQRVGGLSKGKANRMKGNSVAASSAPAAAVKEGYRHADS